MSVGLKKGAESIKTVGEMSESQHSPRPCAPCPHPREHCTHLQVSELRFENELLGRLVQDLQIRCEGLEARCEVEVQCTTRQLAMASMDKEESDQGENRVAC